MTFRGGAKSRPGKLP